MRINNTYRLRLVICYALLLSIMVFSPEAYAKPAKKGVHHIKMSDGATVRVQKYGDEFNHYTLTEDGRPVVQSERGWVYLDADIETLKARVARRTPVYALRNGKETRGPGLMDNFPCHGEQFGLVVLVEYTDVKFKVSDPNEYYTAMLNEKGFNRNLNIASARDYFIDNSNGIFTPTFDVYGPIKLKNKMSYYGGNDRYGYDLRAELMAVEACQQLDATVDFSKYDRDGDGYIDNIYVYYAGYGEADYDDENTVWPHSWSLEESLSDGGAVTKDYYFDGVKLNKYACSNELDGWSTPSRPDGIGTFVHEFSHVMGLPDLYCTQEVKNEPFTPGEYSVLDYGPYNGDGCVPPRYSAYERYALDWLVPRELNSTRNVRLNTIDENVAYIIPTDREREYFLIENRQQEGWDTYLPHHGMLVWHIDFLESVFTGNTVNNSASHQYVDLVEADNKQSENTVTGDPFPGASKVTSFGFKTTPALKSWRNKELVINSIDNIAEDDKTGYVTFRAVKTGDEGTPDFEELTAADCSPKVEDPGTDPGNGDDPNDNPTSVDMFKADSDLAIYSIDGRLVKPEYLAPGIYIRGGKKFIVR